jgi:hypothetical protein
MPNVTTNAQYQQILSMSLEDRSSDYQDLVSNNNALLAVMRRKGLWQTYSGPRIRQTLQIGKQSAQWYSGYDQILNPAIDLFNDAFFEPKMVVVPVVLSMQEILNNEGDAQLIDVMDAYIEAAEKSLTDTMDAGIYSAGTLNGGKQITGLATAVPIVTNTGTYGGIDRSQAVIWQTTTFDASSGAGMISPDVQTLHDAAVARQGLRRPVDHEPEHYTPLRRRRRSPSSGRTTRPRSATGFLGARIYRRRQARRISWMVGSEATCRRTRHWPADRARGTGFTPLAC